ncbi:MAG TPA: hypothetical protein VLD64_09100, partial [Nitrosarchaeum sp.]|nr:hypothetical protein [Nitrosarchaeum sp.]
MEHVLFFDGDTKRISWAIQTDKSIVKQKRQHVEIYLNKVTNIQSKYIGLHIGLFWGVGMFIIKNQDTVKIAVDEKPIFEHLSLNKKNNDEFIDRRTFFIRQFIKQRKLKIQYELISPEKNLAIKIK